MSTVNKKKRQKSDIDYRTLFKFNEEKFSTLFQNSNDAIIIHNLDGEIVDVNRKSSEKLGYSERELLQKNVFSLYPDDQKTIIRKQQILFQKNGFANFESEVFRKGGDRLPVDVSAVSFELSGEQFVHSIMRDITRRKRSAKVQSALYSIAERTSYVEDIQAFYAAIHRIVGELMYADNFYIALYNEKTDEIICPYFVDEFDKEFPLTPRKRKREKGFTEYIIESGIPLLLTRKDIEKMIEDGAVAQLGKVAVDWLGVPLKRGGKAIGVIAVQSYREDIRYTEQDKEVLTFVAQHISNALERKQYLDKLAEERKRLSVTMRSIGDGVITTDVDGNVRLVNDVAESVTGWSQEVAAGKPISEIFDITNMSESGEATGQKVAPVAMVFETDQMIEIDKARLNNSRSNQPNRMISLNAAPIHDETGQTIGTVLAFRDITEKLQMEMELYKSQKLESVGVLAGGIAHDFNNIMTAIIGNISMAKVKIDPEDNAFQRLEEAEKACQRARDLTQQLLTFSKGGTPVKQVIRVAEIVEEAANFALYGSKCRAICHFEDELYSLEADEGQIGQVVNNIVINAVQAMPNGGDIIVNCSNFVVSKKKQRHALPLRPGKYVRISIKDHGIGIPGENIQQVFDPYFSTKQQGSGLGLATCYSIVSKHGGYIAVRSRLGEGSEFTIYLPASRKKAEKTKIVNNQLIKGEGAILVMDDEQPIVDLVGIMLNHLGYEVIKTNDGDAAIAMFRKMLSNGKKFAAIIMDLTVPGGMGGKEALAEIRKMDPDIKAIVASGYSNDPVMSDYQQYGFDARITKPFNLQEISNVLGSLIQTK